MTVTQAIGYKLLNTAAITAYVSTRIHHGEIPEDETTYPVINYFMIDNLSQMQTTMYRSRMQISVRATTPESCWNIAYAVIDALRNIQEDINGFQVQEVLYDNSLMNREEDSIYHVPIDFLITHRRN